MLSQDIRISTTDSHSVIDNETGLRLNNAADIIIEPHVWIGYAAAINKGVIIGHDSVVAGHSVVTKSVEPHTVVAGVPAKPVKGNINWDRKRI
jgi:acetyltransferase-like isoleucine patch superfamily enzyme